MSCSLITSTSTDSEYVDITWKITFSSYKPRKSALVNVFSSIQTPDVYPINQTKHDIHALHDFTEMISMLQQTSFWYAWFWRC